MDEMIIYRQAKPDDLRWLGELFLRAFPESVQHYAGNRMPSPQVMADIFAICLDAEPDAFIVAQRNDRPVGYIFAPSHFTHLISIAITRGHLLRMLWRWVTGRYRIGARPIWIAARNWWLLLRGSHEAPQGGNARILSIAVDPEAQGSGIGSELMRLGLAYLDQQNIREVRLEVRPENASALHLYQKYGFTMTGRTYDSQGQWAVMVRKKGS